ncbi:hypothetical protein A2316_01725 [Candidatus Falkowbacteria bacterium RIFOXYB2_FULL_38_15]|uniref:Uncharacterized protein n=1 Tax=Candidatus Falkowbacteria bacterium RIFOXYA2_FULL_38_12 TaxID=1797993 RepID=A0A1F5S2D5_9BACT|nr:MAG: hypothetical protein A2257_03505 [Candidatus Falkowbacteria bacterium RIFOXYA2_FULL_38_12]OGF32671.1 MAG: hypothetical protein A2316_01725 [Candidatus Falkowbacteria bacterium RIFOXYB2_FULL_38_15]
MDIKRKQIFIVVSISLVAILVSIVFFYLRNKQGVKTNTPKTDFQIFTISENRKRELLLDDTDVIFYDAVAAELILKNKTFEKINKLPYIDAKPEQAAVMLGGKELFKGSLGNLRILSCAPADCVGGGLFGPQAIFIDIVNERGGFIQFLIYNKDTKRMVPFYIDELANYLSGKSP